MNRQNAIFVTLLLIVTVSIVAFGYATGLLIRKSADNSTVVPPRKDKTSATT